MGCLVININGWSFMTTVSDSVNRGTSAARRMQAGLYDWIVYQRRYKAKEKERRKEDRWSQGSYKYLRAAKALVVSEPMAVWQKMAEVLYDLFVRSFCHVTPGPPSSTATSHRFPPVP